MLWDALNGAGPDGISVADLEAACGRTRRWVYYRLREHAAAGRAVQVRAATGGVRPRTGTLGGSNRMLSAREVAAILSVPERTVREKWREWELPAYRIGKHLRWKEREVHAWIDRHAA